ncbi:MAG TPA: sulfatase-like hydrolase/transferase [Candidatus Limnocylindria bacterium]|nr:sulfatase-like hydrolase/transferase [Candidatus Limnocylindria bacterium]
MFLVTLVLASGIGAAYPHDLTRSAERPDLIVVMVDDLGAIDSRILERLPNIKALFLDSGLSFDQYYGEDPLCCPARATFLTGQHVRNHHVTKNDARLLDPSRTVATALHDAGYWTVLTGKYLNLAELLEDRSPPGWDRVDMLLGADKTYAFNPDASVWSVDDQSVVLDQYRDRAGLEFSVAEVEAAPPDQPLFLWSTPRAPHWGTSNRVPWKPAVEARYAADERCDGIEPWKPPSYGYARKPDGFPLGEVCRALLTVDEEVGELQAAVAARGRDAVWFFTGDNGMSWGAHGFPLKRNPWATRLPLYVAGRGIDAGSTDALESQIDLGPTLAEMGGAVMPWADGSSFAGVLFGQPGGREWMIEDQPHGGYTGGRYQRKWRAVRTLRWHLIRFGDTNYLYDLSADPWEMHDVRSEHHYVFRKLRGLFPFWWR